jgi:primase-polymerase (primpol)-like protein
MAFDTDAMSTMMPAAEELPKEIVACPQWLCWREQDRDGKSTKVPIDPTSGSYASATDPSTWADFETARAYAETDAAGLGFVFTDDDPFVGVDLDDCRVPETETTLDWAKEIVDTLNSYTEVSPSGTGYHVLVRGELPGDRNRKGSVELYETARFFTVTGNHVENTPTEVRDRQDALETVHSDRVAPDDETAEDENERPAPSGNIDLEDDQLLSKARDAKNGEKFSRLWRGNTSGYESQSEADMALCSLLAFWTGGDADRVDRLFRDSGLMREKWDEVHFSDGSTYGGKTVKRAISGTNEFYDPATGPEESVVDVVKDSPVNAAGHTSSSNERIESLNRVIERLDRRIRMLETEKDQLRSDLQAERTRRKELEERLKDGRAGSESVWTKFRELVTPG